MYDNPARDMIQIMKINNINIIKKIRLLLESITQNLYHRKIIDTSTHFSFCVMVFNSGFIEDCEIERGNNDLDFSACISQMPNAS